LKDLKAQADTFRRTGREVPPWLQEELQQQEAAAEALRADVQRHAADIETIQARYDADKKRYVELTEAGPR
jgi:molecular chaperone GrpE (heat shock protein)